MKVKGIVSSKSINRQTNTKRETGIRAPSQFTANAAERVEGLHTVEVRVPASQSYRST